MLFEIGSYILDIDVERTREFYLYAQKITDGCNCQGCRNYVAWAQALDAEPKHTLERMGIQLEKTPEVFVNCPNQDGTLYYAGFYHLCGRILKRETSEEPEYVPLSENYHIAFSERNELLEEGFPSPTIQMDIHWNVPFVLPEECVYPAL